MEEEGGKKDSYKEPGYYCSVEGLKGIESC